VSANHVRSLFSRPKGKQRTWSVSGTTRTEAGGLRKSVETRSTLSPLWVCYAPNIACPSIMSMLNLPDQIEPEVRLGNLGLFSVVVHPVLSCYLS
jgi:hypothetical protein